MASAPRRRRSSGLRIANAGAAKLRQALQSLAAENHLRYVSASDWVQNDGEFEDVTHLNEAGAKDYSARLAKELAQLGFRPY